MTETQKGALSRATVEKVERVEELNALSRKYNLPSARLRNASVALRSESAGADLIRERSPLDKLRHSA